MAQRERKRERGRERGRERERGRRGERGKQRSKRGVVVRSLYGGRGRRDGSADIQEETD